jgi:hypothetical protein
VPEPLLFDELRLRVRRGPRKGTYEVFAQGPGDATGRAPFVAPFADEELDAFVRRVDPDRAVRGGAWSGDLMEEAAEFGTALMRALFTGSVRDVYTAAKQRADSVRPRRGLRIALGLSEVPELMDVPWEFLYQAPSFIAQSIRTPLVRSLDLPGVVEPERIEGKLRILAVASQPKNLRRLDARRERARLEEGLKPLVATGVAELEWLQHPWYDELERRMADPRKAPVHVFHFIGHGAFDDEFERGHLFFEDKEGRPREVSGNDLCMVMGEMTTLRLAVLNACEGGRASRVDPSRGVAPALLGCGIAAVVGMQFTVTDEAAITFAERFYSLLVDGFPIDAAVARSRTAIYANDLGVEFATPVLFLRGSQTQIFEAAAPDTANTVAASQLGGGNAGHDSQGRAGDATGARDAGSNAARVRDERERSDAEPAEDRTARNRNEPALAAGTPETANTSDWGLELAEVSRDAFVAYIQLGRATHTLEVVRPPEAKEWIVLVDGENRGRLEGYRPVRGELVSGSEWFGRPASLMEVFGRPRPGLFGLSGGPVGRPLVTIKIDGRVAVRADVVEGGAMKPERRPRRAPQDRAATSTPERRPRPKGPIGDYPGSQIEIVRADRQVFECRIRLAGAHRIEVRPGEAGEYVVVIDDTKTGRLGGLYPVSTEWIDGPNTSLLTGRYRVKVLRGTRALATARPPIRIEINDVVIVDDDRLVARPG